MEPEVVYIAESDRIVQSINGQVHIPLGLKACAELLNRKNRTIELMTWAFEKRLSVTNVGGKWVSQLPGPPSFWSGKFPRSWGGDTLESALQAAYEEIGE